MTLKLDLLQDCRPPRTCKIDLGETGNHLHRRDRKNVQLYSGYKIISLCCILYSGPITSSLCDNIGPRLTMLLGGCLAAIGPLVCAFANNISEVFISSGLIMGK